VVPVFFQLQPVYHQQDGVANVFLQLNYFFQIKEMAVDEDF